MLFIFFSFGRYCFYPQGADQCGCPHTNTPPPLPSAETVHLRLKGKPRVESVEAVPGNLWVCRVVLTGLVERSQHIKGRKLQSSSSVPFSSSLFASCTLVLLVIILFVHVLLLQAHTLSGNTLSPSLLTLRTMRLMRRKTRPVMRRRRGSEPRGLSCCFLTLYPL